MAQQVQSTGSRAANALAYIASFKRYPLPDVYVFLGDAENSNNIKSLLDSEAASVKAFDRMLVGKRILVSDLALMFPRINWSSGKVYPQYDPSADANDPYHVIILSGVDYNVYLCLDNSKGQLSTVAPSSTSTFGVRTSDGYVWKYVSTIPKTTFDKFKTNSHAPYVANSSVVANAVKSSIEVIRVTDGGLHYNNYFAGQFITQDLAFGTTTFHLPESANSTLGFYTGCVLKIVSPLANTAGQFSTITSYTASGNTRVLTIATPFSELPAPGTLYEISPEVIITPTGPIAIPARARALINSAAGNSVGSIEVMTIGSNHLKAAAQVIANNAVGVIRAAAVAPVVSPFAGHGGNLPLELNASSVGLVSVFTNTADLPRSNDFSQFGVISGAHYNRVGLTLQSANPSQFANGESVLQFNTIGNIGTGQLTGSAISGSNSAFLQSVVSGSKLLFTSNTKNVIVEVDSVYSDHDLSIKGTYIGAVNGAISLVRITGTATVQDNSNTTHLILTSASGGFQPNQKVYGTKSYAYDTSTGLLINNSAGKTFNAFKQTTAVLGTATGTFVQDEKLVHSNAAINCGGTLHSITFDSGVTTLNITSSKGSFPPGNLIGQTSGASLNIANKYYGDLTPGEGTLLFLGNILPIQRQANVAETVKVILEF